MNREPSLDFAQALRELAKRAGMPESEKPAEIKLFDLKPVKRDPERVKREYERMKLAVNNAYLLSRGIDKDVLGSRRFLGCIKQDYYKNAVFPHYDKGLLCGFERRNEGYKGFSKGGAKILWSSNKLNGDNRLLIVESGIDALSHFMMTDESTTRYVSIGGEMSPEATAVLVDTIHAFSNQGEVICGLDNDKAGMKLTEKIGAACGLTLNRDKPTAKDWNDDLKIKMKIGA